MLAVYVDALSVAVALVDRGADINSKDVGGNTRLFYVAQGNAVETARFLLDRGVDIHARDNGGMTPLDVTENTEIQNILRSWSS